MCDQGGWIRGSMLLVICFIPGIGRGPLILPLIPQTLNPVVKACAGVVRHSQTSVSFADFWSPCQRALLPCRFRGPSCSAGISPWPLSRASVLPFHRVFKLALNFAQVVCFWVLLRCSIEFTLRRSLWAYRCVRLSCARIVCSFVFLWIDCLAERCVIGSLKWWNFLCNRSVFVISVWFLIFNLIVIIDVIGVLSKVAAFGMTNSKVECSLNV